MLMASLMLTTAWQGVEKLPHQCHQAHHHMMVPWPMLIEVCWAHHWGYYPKLATTLMQMEASDVGEYQRILRQRKAFQEVR